MNKSKMMAGFTLVEIMIIVTIISILVTVAVPNFVRYRKTSQMSACISNLRQINTAYEQAKIQGKSPTSVEELCGPTMLIKKTPLCPTTGTNTYSLPESDDECPACSNSTEDYPHKLPT